MNEVKNTNVLETSHRLKKVWLVKVNGYTVLSTRRNPHAGMFGSIRYTNVWVLEKK